MKKQSEKQEDLDKLKTELAKVSTVILTTFQGITVEDDTKLRRAVQAAGGKYRVVKNTLAERAGAGHSAESLLKNLRGHEFDRLHRDRPGRAGKGADQGRQGCSGVQVQVRRGRRPRLRIAEIQQLANLAVEGRVDQQDHVPAERAGAAHRQGAARVAAQSGRDGAAKRSRRTSLARKEFERGRITRRGSERISIRS